MSKPTVSVKCRGCGWAGPVSLVPGSGKHKRSKKPAATGVPCPKCGKHMLRRTNNE